MQRDGEEKARPLAVGIHGAAYNSTYFDANASTATEELCRALGIPFVSINRPQVRGSTPYPPETEGDDDIARQGHYLAQTVLPAVLALGTLWIPNMGSYTGCKCPQSRCPTALV